MRMHHYSVDKIAKSIEKGAKLGLTTDEIKGKITAAKEAIAHECRGCMMQARRPSKQRNEGRAKHPGELVHMDFLGPIDTPGYSGELYVLVIMDDNTRWAQAYPMRKKSDAPRALDAFMAEARKHGYTVRTLRSDNEIILKATLTAKGIAWEPTPTYDPMAGGRHEALVGLYWNQTMKTMESAKHLPTRAWPAVIKSVALVRNNLVHDATGQIPQIEWAKKATDLTRMRTVG